MEKYNHKKIEKKWAKKWIKDKIFTPNLGKSKDPYYALFMFPYPSAEGLHIGNFYAFTCVDVMAKYKKLQGKDVFEPIGFDAFGIHSENYALKISETPKKMLNRTIANFRTQLSSSGLGCDWTREVNTTTPEYYKWTQWIFTKLFEKGLAYQKEALLNWCPGCKTVLADEQIEGGVCERCKSTPKKKKMKQWFFKITAYAERLLDGLENMDWSEITKHAQKNWIGRSEGSMVKFSILSPQFGKIGNLKLLNSKEITESFKFRTNSINKILLGDKWATFRIEEKNIKVGNLIDIIDWADGKKENQKKVVKAIITKVKRLKVKDIQIDYPGHEKYNSLDEFKKELEKYYSKKINNNDIVYIYEFAVEKFEQEIFTTRPDTLFGATYFVLSPEHPIVNQIVATEQKKEVEKYIKKASIKSELERTESKEKTGVFIGAYAINPVNNEKIPVWIADYVLMGYGTGAIMAVPAHDERDFEFAKKYNLEIRQVVRKIDKKNKVIILHGMQRHENKDIPPQNIRHWLGWLKDELEKNGIEAINPLIPRDWEASYEEWKKEIDKINIDENTTLVGMSAGGAFWVRWLGETKKKINKLILIAPAKSSGDSDDKNKKSFYDFDIDPEIKGRVKKIIIFISNNDDERIIKATELYTEKLSVKLIKLENRGHFTIKANPINKKFPELLEEIINEECFSDEGMVVNSNFLDNLKTKDAKKKIIKWLEKKDLGKGTVNYRLRDWCISRQRYWGPPVPIIYCKKCAKGNNNQVLMIHGWEDNSKSGFFPSLKNNLESKGYEVFAFSAPNTNKPIFEKWHKFIESKIKENNLNNFILIGHSMGGLLSLKLAEKYKIKKLVLVAPVGYRPSEKYFGQFKNKLGKDEMEIFRNYQNRKLDFKLIKKNTQEIEFIFGNKDSWITKEIRDFYKDNFKERAQINILKDYGHMSNDEGIIRMEFIENLFKEIDKLSGVYSVLEKDLPVRLPELEKGWEPAGDGRGPLAKINKFMKTKCPVCGAPAEREPDVMDNFLDSAWYFFRYISPQNNKEIFDKKLGKKWLPVDLYVGGNEHAVLHLMYTRFITMALHDLGLINFDNPFKRFRANGMILKDGKKMSKSKGNVVNPEEYGEKVGYDALKTYLLFLGPLSEDRSFSDAGVQGAKRWVDRIYRMEEKVDKNYNNKNVIRKFHKTIKSVTKDFEDQKYNTAIAHLMELTNSFNAEKNISSLIWTNFLALIAPFAPAVAEELWERLGNNKSIFDCGDKANWPEYDKKLIKDDTINLVVQINGKLRDMIEANADINEEDAKKIVLESEKIKKWINGKKIVKIIFVKGKLMNIVAK